MFHQNNLSIARETGCVYKSMFLCWIDNWLQSCKANKYTSEKTFHDGRYWIYHSVASLQEEFFYIKRTKIKTMIRELQADGYIEIGHYDRYARKQINWYTLTGKFYRVKEQAASEQAEEVENLPPLNETELGQKTPTPDLKQIEPVQIPTPGRKTPTQLGQKTPTSRAENAHHIRKRIDYTLTDKNIDSDDYRDKIGFKISNKNADRESGAVGVMDGHNYFAFNSRELDGFKRDAGGNYFLDANGNKISIKIDNPYWLATQPLNAAGFGIDEKLMDLFLQCKIPPARLLELFQEIKAKNPTASGLFLHVMNQEIEKRGFEKVDCGKNSNGRWKNDPRLRK